MCSPLLLPPDELLVVGVADRAMQEVVGLAAHGAIDLSRHADRADDDAGGADADDDDRSRGTDQPRHGMACDAVRTVVVVIGVDVDQGWLGHKFLFSIHSGNSVSQRTFVLYQIIT